MKQLMILATLLVVLSAGCSPDVGYRNAIQRVFDERFDAMRKSARDGNLKTRNGVASINRKKFVSEIEKINVSDCPKEFRTAWADYVIANRTFSNSQTGFGDLIGVAILGYASPLSGISAASQLDAKQNSATQSLSDSWNDCLKIAIRYGVDLHSVLDRNKHEDSKRGDNR